MGSKVGGMERVPAAVEQRSDEIRDSMGRAALWRNDSPARGPTTKPWGRSNFAVFEEWQGSQCWWRKSEKREG